MPAITLRLQQGYKKSSFFRPCMSAALNSSYLSFRSCKNRHLRSYPLNSQNSENWLLSTGPPSMLCFQCIGPIIERAPKRRNPISALMSTDQSLGKYSLRTAMAVNGHLSARSWNPARLGSWTEATNAIKILTLGKVKQNTSSAALRPTPKEPAWKATRYFRTASYFSMPRSCWDSLASTRQKNLYAWLATKSAA